MRISSFSVRNLTSLLEVVLEDLPDLVVFIGKNSSGKSNLIDALALLFFDFGNELQRDLGHPDNRQHLFPNHNTEIGEPTEITVSISLTSSEWAELLDLADDNESTFGDLFLRKRLFSIEDVTYWKTYEVAVEDFAIVRDGEIVESEYLLAPEEPEPEEPEPEEQEGDDLVDVNPEEFLSRLGALLRSSFQIIHTTENPRSRNDRFVERPTILDPEHLRALWELSQSKGNQRQPWTRVIQRYEKISPNGQRPVGVASSIQLEEGTLSVPVGMTGEGSQAMLRLIDQLERGPSTMVIEEPETHLHPALIKQVGHLLSETTEKGKQLFISTHSPFLVEQSSLANFFVVRKQGYETLVSPMGDLEDLRDLLLDIGMRPSDVLFSDAILLVEGWADEIFFNRLSNKIEVPLAERHIKTLRVGGYPRGRRQVEFWAGVGVDAGLPLYMILDENARDEADGALAKEQIRGENCLILDKGNLEDHYPWRALSEALSTKFEVYVEEPIPVGERVETLRRILSRKFKGKNAWKPPVAEAVAEAMTVDEAESETQEIVGFLRRMYHTVGIE